ncbi:hypothetical protein OHD62_33170, partial [Mesorhizobium sp. YC-39]|uniref:hypothetical protein n=1 Tax=Mesorhizobium sp. YC-39 TaxID=2986065 RepID=UPI0021E82591
MPREKQGIPTSIPDSTPNSLTWPLDFVSSPDNSSQKSPPQEEAILGRFSRRRERPSHSISPSASSNSREPLLECLAIGDQIVEVQGLAPQPRF